jgi:hypothetical protein
VKALKTKGLVLGISLMGLGAIGWLLVFIFSSNYYLATNHGKLNFLGHLALGIGPTVIILGSVLFFAFFAEGYYHKPVQSLELGPGTFPAPEQTPKKNCPNCGTQNPVEAVFCFKCGQEFSGMDDNKNVKEGF